MTPVIDLQGVRTGYRGLTLIDEANLTVMPGETVALFGRSGSGKTTLLNVVAGLQRADTGRVLVLGREVTGLSAGAAADLRRTHYGLILQSYGLLSQLSARENITFALRLAGTPRRDWHKRTEETLAAVGLINRAHYPPAALSGGERQRIAVARALAVQPRVILADEPTGALDHLTGQVILTLLRTYAREHGAGILMVTHDPGVRTSVTRSYQIRAGRLSLLEEESA